jgi:hypothetical protein
LSAGVIEDDLAVTALLHRYGALAFWDYATAAPYVNIDVNPKVFTIIYHSTLQYSTVDSLGPISKSIRIRAVTGVEQLKIKSGSDPQSSNFKYRLITYIFATVSTNYQQLYVYLVSNS